MERKGFGRLIREGRKARGWTQVEFAERMNASPTTVSNWEREDTAPGLEDINPMVSLLPFSAEALLTALGIQMMPLATWAGWRFAASGPRKDAAEVAFMSIGALVTGIAFIGIMLYAWGAAIYSWLF